MIAVSVDFVKCFDVSLQSVQVKIIRNRLNYIQTYPNQPFHYSKTRVMLLNLCRRIEISVPLATRV